MKTAVRRSGSCAGHVLAASFAAMLLLGSWASGQEPAVPSKAADAPGAQTAQPAPHAWAGISSLEQFLTRALATHPEIVAAQAKVASAEEELRRTRFQVARELIAFWYDWKAKERDVAEMTKLAGQRAASQSELMDAKAKLAAMESQLPYLLGDRGGAGTRRPGAAGEVGSKRLPEGPMVEKVLEALNSPAELEFIETPLQDVADTLMDFHRVTFVVDPVVSELPITKSIRGVPLGAALQAVEDSTPGVRFVVCDYGILVTSDTSDAAATYISANEFWRKHQAESKSAKAPPTVPTQPGKAQPSKAGSRPVPDDPFAPGPPTKAEKPPDDPFAPAPATPDPFAPGPGPAEKEKPQ